MVAVPYRPAPSPTVADAIADVSTISGYFELGVGPIEPGWRPLTDLPVEQRIADVAERLGTGETRVAASILFQGLAARLWSPAVGAAVAHGLLVDLAPARLHWYPAAGGPLPLRAERPTGWHVADAEDVQQMAEPLYRTVVSGLLEPLARAVQEVVRIAPGLLWGNAASSLAGAVRAIARGRPGLAARAAALGRELLEMGVLRGTGDLVEPAPGQPFFVRRSCCLYYRVPGGGMCEDCVLIDQETRRAQWETAMRVTRG
ncbi:(2Fe-2S)-binding protein [Nonomuraea sp. NPDC059194]|uniref:(2Fe-2S)-binding protein n=1 Tax=Nonomuraea sp. NPDC059194 TaxID=3346764 RepID=UPI0036BE2DE8